VEEFCRNFGLHRIVAAEHGQVGARRVQAVGVDQLAGALYFFAAVSFVTPTES
jgi:hypothetical protein